MAYQIFTIPIVESEAATQALNRFLASHQVLQVDRQFYGTAAQAYWCFCVNYVPGTASTSTGKAPAAGKIDYKEVLSDEDFAVFAKLREVRKQIGEELSLPLFAIFTNEQLAEMSRRRAASLNQLQEIPGIGEKKANTYGDRFLAILKHAATKSKDNDPEGGTTRNDLFSGGK